MLEAIGLSKESTLESIKKHTELPEEKINFELQRLIKVGDVYEVRPGVYKVLI